MGNHRYEIEPFPEHIQASLDILRASIGIEQKDALDDVEKALYGLFASREALMKEVNNCHSFQAFIRAKITDLK